MLTRPHQQARALVFGIQDEGPIVDVGAYNEAASPAVAEAGHASAVRNGTQHRRFPHSAWPDEQLIEEDAYQYQSTVPLDGLVRAEVQAHVSTGEAYGMLLTYENGGQRAVGVVSLDGDSYTSTVYERPVRICFTFNAEMIGTWVHFLCAADPDVTNHVHTDDGKWESHALRGRIEWAVDTV